jgi:hypothetical protein
VQPLGLTSTQYAAYLRYVTGSHNFTVTADVLNIAMQPLAGISETLLDGQVNIQRDGPVRRTCTLSFFDPDNRLQFDSDSPFASTLFLDRMVRVRHVVWVPGVGTVSATPFVGPVTNVSRDGEVLSVELQDKASLVARGRVPLTVKKGSNAVAAIKRIMQAAGERHFRLPDASKRRLPKSYTVGWSDDASPWVVCERIARYLNLKLGYSCDGYLTLRRLPAVAAVTFGESTLTAPIRTTFDATQVFNTVRVEGTKKPRARPSGSSAAAVREEKIALTSVARASHPLSPVKLGRNGSNRYLPLIIEGDEYAKQSDARTQANRALKDVLAAATSVASISTVPLFHLDNDDLVNASTDAGTVKMRFNEGSIPLGVGGDMTIGTQRAVSVKGRWRRRG